jgi:ABC-2 type transport system ATP-binding protein
MNRIERAVIRRGDVAAVADLSLQAAAGEAWGVIGASGCGKGALVAAVAGAEPLAGGDIIVAGRSVRGEPDAARRQCGYAPADLEVWPAVRADEFLDLFGIAAGLSGAVLEEARGRALELSGLRGHDRLDTIPRGAAKRLLLGRAVLHDPAVLALDDPFRCLDPVEQAMCDRLIEAAVLVDCTVIAALDNAIVPACFTHVALMDSGRIIARGPAHPAAFAPGRTWTWRVTVVRNGTGARECLADRVPEAHLIDDLTVDCRIDPALSPPATLVTALVRSGIAVESAGFHPFWSMQLVPSDG